jgi:hypothetical protein
MITAKECLQTAEVCLALARKIKELDKRAALLEFAYDFRTVAKLLERNQPLRSLNQFPGLSLISRPNRQRAGGGSDLELRRCAASCQSGVCFAYTGLPRPCRWRPAGQGLVPAEAKWLNSTTGSSSSRAGSTLAIACACATWSRRSIFIDVRRAADGWMATTLARCSTMRGRYRIRPTIGVNAI